MIDPEVLLEKLPKRTPLWAVGAVTLIVSLVVSFAGVYILVKGEFQQYLTYEFQSRERDAATLTAEVDRQGIVEKKAFDTVLELIQINSKQITELTISNNRLTERVTGLEKDLDSVSRDLRKCEESLKSIKG